MSLKAFGSSSWWRRHLNYVLFLCECFAGAGQPDGDDDDDDHDDDDDDDDDDGNKELTLS